MTKRTENWQGSKWIRRDKRLAIYLRDGMACVYCGATVEDGTQLALDHLRPHSKGGTNHETNLVTCCGRCNSSRGNRSVRGFCQAVAAYLNHGVDTRGIERHVRNCAKRTLPRADAKKLIASRGNFAAAVCTAHTDTMA